MGRHNFSGLGAIVSCPVGSAPYSTEVNCDPATNQLTIAAIQPGGRVYINAIVTAGTIVSVGGIGP
jgi:hypothetical protein